MGKLFKPFYVGLEAVVQTLMPRASGLMAIGCCIDVCNFLHLCFKGDAVMHDAGCLVVTVGGDTIRYDSEYLTCSKKLTGSPLSLPHRRGGIGLKTATLWTKVKAEGNWICTALFL